MSRSIGEKLKKVILFLKYLPLQIRTLKICNHDISTRVSRKVVQLGASNLVI